MLDVENLKIIMRKKGFKSLRELSKKSGVPYSTINYMIAGHDMCISTILNIANVLNEPLETLLKPSHNYMLFDDKNGKTLCRNIKANNLYEVTLLYMM